VFRVLLVSLLMLASSLSFAQDEERRIISLNGDATEILFALGAGDQLVAVDASSNYPEEATELPNLGYQGNLSVEALLGYEPTHVIATEEAEPSFVLEQLADVGVEVVKIATQPSLETPVQNIRQMAALVGREELGEELAVEVEEKIEAAVARGEELEYEPRVMFLYLGARNMQFAGGAESTSNVMIEAAGGVDAGAEIGLVGTVPITAEALVASQPDVLIVTDRGINQLGGIEGVLELPGIRQTPAGMNEHIIVFEDLYFLGMGPRTGDALTDLVEQLHDLQ